MNKSICYYFNKGYCKNKKCNYLHIKTIPCYYYKKGYCKYGDKCLYSHFVEDISYTELNNEFEIDYNLDLSYFTDDL